MSWQKVLVAYAKKEPATLAKAVYIEHSDKTVTIYDKYPKAKYHYLTLPRLPYKSTKSGLEISQTVLDNLAALIASKHALDVLTAMKADSDKIVQLIENKMMNEHGFTWPISRGFHAIESMSHVHLHIISNELVSEHLKTKKHYNSFNPVLGFFLSLDDILQRVETRTMKEHAKPKSTYEKMLTAQMQCFHCDYTTRSVPDLKTHLQDHFDKLQSKRPSQQLAETSICKRQASDDSDSEVGVNKHSMLRKRSKLDVDNVKTDHSPAFQ